MSPIFVTGATGFVGSAVARSLVSRGYKLRLLARPKSDRRNLSDLDAEIIEGDLSHVESYSDALQGCRYLFHVAADYRLWVPDPEKMMQINVESTRQLMQAAQKAGIQRMVYCSSVAALGLVGDGSIANEATPVHKESIIGAYKQSKYQAEQVVLDMVRNQQLPAVIVNPSTPIGPRDIKPTPTGQMIVDCASGKTPAYVDTGLNIVHVDDVAEGHILALEKGEIGEKYILGGENMSLCEFFTIVAQVAGVRAPLFKINQKVLWPVAIMSEWLAKNFSIQPKVTREMLAMSYKKMYFSSEKAEKKLGYTHRSARIAIEDAIKWFRQQNMIH